MHLVSDTLSSCSRLPLLRGLEISVDHLSFYCSFCGVMSFCQLIPIRKGQGQAPTKRRFLVRRAIALFVNTCIRSSVSTVMIPGAWCTRYLKGNRVITLASRDGDCAFLCELFSRSKPSVSPGYRAEGVGKFPLCSVARSWTV